MWLFMILLMAGKIGRKLGIQYLFLDPEYQGDVGFLSFFFVGLAYASFLMSWNLTVYLLSAHYFPFLASLSRPFTKFSFNNFVLPLSFSLTYIGLVIHFQRYYENLTFGVILLNCLGLFAGFLALTLGYALYFNFTNRDISYYKGTLQSLKAKDKNITPGRRDVDLDYIKLDENRWNVKTYLNEYFRPRLVRSVAHYDRGMLMNIFKQNHLNALITQLLSMMFLLALGYLIDNPIFRIPAAASILIMLSIFTAVVGAVTYWFNEWRVTVIIILLFLINYFTSFDIFHHNNRAYGLNYDGPIASYDYQSLDSICSTEQVAKDRKETIEVLENWKAKVKKSANTKPKMVILSVSGGGFKSATWAMRVVQKADSMTNGQLLDHTVLITGASGGLLGMGYLRELLLRKKQGEAINIYQGSCIDDLTKDLLNPIAFTIVSNDLFLPWTKFEAGGYEYHKDRGYIFEKQLNENTNGYMNKSIADYELAERQAIIPMMYLTPSIINDARRLVISPLGASFMMMPPIGLERKDAVEIDAVDFGLLFKEQDAYNLRFLTALRMNATYPYVLPNVHLPSDREIEVMDAGFIDNYGLLSATRFIQVFQDWIKENTSGVVLLQISSSQKIERLSGGGRDGIIESLIKPLGIAGKVLARQEFEHDTSLGFIFDLMGKDYFEVIRFIYEPTEDNKLEASISFHITQREKEKLYESLNSPKSIQKLETVKKIFYPPYDIR